MEPLAIDSIRRPQPERFVACRPIERVGGLRLKRYEITRTRRGGVSPLVRGAADERIEEVVGTIGAPSPAYDGGYTILHAGEHAAWLMTCWWTDECLLMQRMHRAEVGSAEFVPHDTGLLGCTWEIAVHAHERAAWCRHVLYTDAPDGLERYLEDQLTGTI